MEPLSETKAAFDCAMIARHHLKKEDAKVRSRPRISVGVTNVRYSRTMLPVSQEYVIKPLLCLKYLAVKSLLTFKPLCQKIGSIWHPREEDMKYNLDWRSRKRLFASKSSL